MRQVAFLLGLVLLCVPAIGNASKWVGSVDATYRVGWSNDCRSTVIFQKLKDGNWINVHSVPGEGHVTKTTSFSVNDTIDGIRVTETDLNTCYVDYSVLTLSGDFPDGSLYLECGQNNVEQACCCYYTTHTYYLTFGLQVNSTGDDDDADPNDNMCFTGNIVDGGNECTLRAAIQEANARAGQDTITFDIPGEGVPKIQPATPLPEVTDPVFIDGATQPGGGKVELNGAGIGADGDGLVITAGASTVKGFVINGFPEMGIILKTGDGNTVEGSYVGTNAAGDGPMGNDVGIWIENSAQNVIRNNVISGNGHGVIIGDGSASNRVEDNTIGTDVSGALAVPNGENGVTIFSFLSENSIKNNIISGNGKHGVQISGEPQGEPVSGKNRVESNYIGTNKAGTQKLPNGEAGVRIFNNSDNIVEANVISGNSETGVWIEGAGSGGPDLGNPDPSPKNNQIKNNFIGTDPAGTKKLGNGSGVLLDGDVAYNTIQDNIISGNDGCGVRIEGAGTEGNVIQNNRIGTDQGGSGDLGNSADGVYAADGTGSLIEGNTIAFNGKAGVLVDSGDGWDIKGNAIFANAQLGIDLLPIPEILGGLRGVTLNDLDDSDNGGNDLQNFPTVTLAGSDGSITKIKGSLNSSLGTDRRFRLEFFANPSCDGSGYGEGETFLGATEIQTELDGQGTFDVVFSVAVPPGHFITATATQPAVYSGQTYNSTSEFSQCAPVVELFTLNVVNGTGSGPYEAGAEVNISANAPSAGRIFDQWTGGAGFVADFNSANTTVTMPAADVTVTATYKDDPEKQFALTVVNGTGSGQYEAGTVVNISAHNPAAGKVFEQWTGDTAHVADMNSTPTTITMPAANVIVTATYRDQDMAYVSADGCGDNNPCYSTLSEAVSSVKSDTLIKVAGNLSADTTVDAGKTLYIEFGYDADFNNNQGGVTEIKGTFTAKDKTVIRSGIIRAK